MWTYAHPLGAITWIDSIDPYSPKRSDKSSSATNFDKWPTHKVLLHTERQKKRHFTKWMVEEIRKNVRTFSFVLTMWDVKGDRFQFEKAYNVIYYIVFLRSSILLLCFDVITFPFSEEVKNTRKKKKNLNLPDTCLQVQNQKNKKKFLLSICIYVVI